MGEAKVRAGASSRVRKSRRQVCVGIAAGRLLRCGDARINDLRQPKCELFPVCPTASTCRRPDCNLSRPVSRPILQLDASAGVLAGGQRTAGGHSTGTQRRRQISTCSLRHHGAPRWQSVTLFPRATTPARTQVPVIGCFSQPRAAVRGGVDRRVARRDHPRRCLDGNARPRGALGCRRNHAAAWSWSRSTSRRSHFKHCRSPPLGRDRCCRRSCRRL